MQISKKIPFNKFWSKRDSNCKTQFLATAPFAWLGASVQGGMEAISLWYCWGLMEGQAALIAASILSEWLWCLSSSSWRYSLDFQWGFRSGQFAGQPITMCVMTPEVPTPAAIHARWPSPEFLNKLCFHMYADDIQLYISIPPWDYSPLHTESVSKYWLTQ